MEFYFITPSPALLTRPVLRGYTERITALSDYRILSIDGGGIRGIISAVLLERINKETDFLKSVDLAAGTSTGGLIALAVAAGLDISVIKDIYLKKGKFIFADSWCDDVKDLLGLTGADYDITNLKQVLVETFGDAKLKDLKKHVLVTAFELDNISPDPLKRQWQPKHFTNFAMRDIHDEPVEEPIGETPVYKAGLYTAAAPTYFPAVDGFVDGGIFAGNPSMEALCSAPYGEPVLFSLGTGIALKHIEGKFLDWGYAQWLKKITDMMMDGQQQSAHHQCKELLGERYKRLAPVFGEGVDIKMDDVDRLDYMVQFAESVDISEAVKFIKEVWL